MTDHATARLLEALDRTLAEGSARFDVRAQVTLSSGVRVGPSSEEMAKLTEAQRAGVVAVFAAFYAMLIALLSLISLTGRRRDRPRRDALAGTVDFALERYLKPARLPANSRSDAAPDVDYLYVCGRRFVGKPGRWFELPSRPAGYGSPFWYLQVARAAVAVSDEGATAEESVHYQRLTVTADFATAAREHELQAPEEVGEDELRHLTLEVLIDREGRAERIDHLIVTPGRTDRRGVAFFDFGARAEIHEPRPEQLTDIDPRRPRSSTTPTG